MSQDPTDQQAKRRPGPGPRGELTIKEAARILGGVHRSRIVYWQSKGWLANPLTRASVDEAKRLLDLGQWPPKEEKPTGDATGGET